MKGENKGPKHIPIGNSKKHHCSTLEKKRWTATKLASKKGGKKTCAAKKSQSGREAHPAKKKKP